MMKYSKSFSLFIILIVIVLLYFIGVSGALRDVDIILPRYVRRGEDVLMTCNYNLEQDQIYAVNWYRISHRKKAQEFYRYVPKEAPSQKAFHIPGFQVDVRRSSDHNVYLRNVSLDISGTYKCSVTAEQTFQTLSSANEMTVVVIGEGPPSVYLDRSQYQTGDQVTAECQSPFSIPPANITWFYNETEVSYSTSPLQHIKTEYLKSATDPMLQSTFSRYSFDLLDQFPTTNRLIVKIKCRVTLYTLYDQNSTARIIAPISRQLIGTETLTRQGASSSPSQMSFCRQGLRHLVCFIILIISVVNIN